MTKKKAQTKKRIFLLEDHAVLRQCLKLFIEQEPDMEVCGGAGNAAEAFAAIKALQPDAVITDISMPGMNGIEFLKNLKALHPGIATVVLSMHDESIYAERALRAGALGYVMKKESTGEVIAALRKAFVGERHVGEKVTASLVFQALGRNVPGKKESHSPIETLSDRELEVFEHLGRGKSTKDIAASLGVSAKTVETHRMHIKEKLQIGSVTELVQNAAVWVERETSGDWRVDRVADI
ncbi:MAG: response regulator transcription factor [Verrucomicrobiota bacterium]